MDSYIRFMAPVIPQSANQLLRVVDQKIAAGTTKLHLMISSPGGSVFHGLSIYNYLKGAPVEVITYNFGSVDSIGVVMFCAGDIRISVPNARFLIHGVSMNIQGPLTLEEKGIEEKLKALKIDYQNIANVIAETCGKERRAVTRNMNARTTLSPQEAQEYGLVHEIRSNLFPAGADVSFVYEDGVQQQLPQQIIMPQGIPFPLQIGAPIQHITRPPVQAVTFDPTIMHTTIETI